MEVPESGVRAGETQTRHGGDVLQTQALHLCDLKQEVAWLKFFLEERIYGAKC